MESDTAPTCYQTSDIYLSIGRTISYNLSFKTTIKTCEISPNVPNLAKKTKQNKKSGKDIPTPQLKANGRGGWGPPLGTSTQETPGASFTLIHPLGSDPSTHIFPKGKPPYSTHGAQHSGLIAGSALRSHAPTLWVQPICKHFQLCSSRGKQEMIQCWSGFGVTSRDAQGFERWEQRLQKGTRPESPTGA